MNRTPAKPRHPSYMKHRRQVLWQIVLPIIVAFLLLIGGGYLVARATFVGGGDVGRWAAISTIWLTLPVMLATLVMTLILAGMGYLIGRLSGLIPRYTFPVQRYAAEMEAGAHKIEHLGHKPLAIFPELGRLIRWGYHRIRNR